MHDGEGQTASVDPANARRRFGSYLAGTGVELGPGHIPFPVEPGVVVSYVDRWEPEQNEQLFPELGNSPGFPTPDIVADLDVDRLGALGRWSQDFVIASHIIEHLANPLAMLKDIYRVLKPGGLLILLLPDRLRTFDRTCQPTALSHVVNDYRSDVRDVDESHLVDFIVGSHAAIGLLRDPDTIETELIDLHRRRSIHVHVWTREEFLEVLGFATEKLRLRWRFIDSMEAGSPDTKGDEFGWVLQKRGSVNMARAFNRFRRPRLAPTQRH